jgi:hypothetical protein
MTGTRRHTGSSHLGPRFTPGALGSVSISEALSLHRQSASNTSRLCAQGRGTTSRAGRTSPYCMRTALPRPSRPRRQDRRPTGFGVVVNSCGTRCPARKGRRDDTGGPRGMRIDIHGRQFVRDDREGWMPPAADRRKITGPGRAAPRFARRDGPAARRSSRLPDARRRPGRRLRRVKRRRNTAQPETGPAEGLALGSSPVTARDAYRSVSDISPRRNVPIVCLVPV